MTPDTPIYGNVYVCATNLTKYNDMTMGELFKKYE